MSPTRPDLDAPEVAVRVEQVFVTKGKSITVWLCVDGATPTQVELRVGKRGEPEVFLRAEHMGVVKDFATWVPLGADPSIDAAIEAEGEA